MIDNKSVIAIITARGGSKGLPGKNTMVVGEKPLIAWTIEAAQNTQLVDRLILSSDDNEIISIANQFSCESPFKRPDELATDEASIYDVIIHALDAIEESYDFVVLLQPTSPLRTAEDIDECIKLCHQSNTPSCVAMCETPKSPHWMYQLDNTKRITPILDGKSQNSRRQDLPAAYVVNGAVYVARTDWFRENKTFIDAETCAYIMPYERSIDIDSAWDMKLLQFIIENDNSSAPNGE